MIHRVDFDLQPPLPPIALDAARWGLEEQCNFSSQLFNSLYYAVTMTLIRELGYDRTYEIHARLLRHHQEHFFLTGLRKLGLHREKSDAVRCAKYHCISNALGGVRTGYGIENANKAWMFYFPHTPDNAWPGQSSLAHSRGNMLADYLGWHSNNGKLLGNPGLRYVATHFVCDGDPFDGGYFEDTGRDLGTEERVVQRLGEAPPESVEIQKTQLDPAEWPADRKSKALRNYAVTWAADRVWSVLDSCGAQGDPVAQRALQAVLFAWMPRFEAATGAADGFDVAGKVASYLALFHSVMGLKADTSAQGDSYRVVLDRGFDSFVGGTLTDEQRARFAKVARGAWQFVGTWLGCSIEANDTATVWSVRRK